MKNKVYITKRDSFEAAHHLPNHYGKCANLHGHSYKLEVTVSGFIDAELMMQGESYNAVPDLGMVIDFSTLKTYMKKVVDKFDHSNLNDYFVLPTAEIMTVDIFNTLQADLSHYDIKVECVKLWETEGSYAEYRGETE